MNKTRMTMKQRMIVAVEFLKTRVVKNISRPVTVSISPRGGRVVTERSKKGEFPKKDLGLLFRSVFGEVKENRAEGVVEGYVGMPLDYGVILETSEKLDRKFLTKTLAQESSRIKRMLTGPIA